MDKLKLLIIDDDKVDRLNYRKLLANNLSFQIELIEADTAKQGIELWRDNQLDCVLLDYNLPDMNGLAFIDKIKNMNGHTTPIVMLTGENNVKTIVTAMKSGVTDYITKNEINTTILVKTIQNAINQLKLAKQLELNREIEERKKISDEEHRIKYEFLSNMSHELRTPLTKIIGFAQLIQNEVLGSINVDQNAALVKLCNSAKYLLKIINNAIDILAIDSGEFTLEPKEFCLATVINEVINEISPKAIKKQIKITTILDNKIINIYLDPIRFKNILVNFLENAVNFTAEGGHIDIRIKADKGGMFCLEVEDTGIGIASKDLSALFDPFKPLDASATKKYVGTGLGLALVKRIVEFQGGHVNVTSTQGKGSVFSATFPRKYQQSAACLDESNVTVTD